MNKFKLPLDLPKIAVVVPTIRPQDMEKFIRRWQWLFWKHKARLFVVNDGDKPTVQEIEFLDEHEHRELKTYRPGDVASNHRHWLFNKNDGVRNLGFLAALKSLEQLETIITLDDDVFPYVPSDPIASHLSALQLRVPINWFTTAQFKDRPEPAYMRGFPYGVREEAEVLVSHGVWEGIHDWDGPTQLVCGNRPVTFYRGPVPTGCLTPVCGMNLAFKVEALPYLYFAPMGRKLGVQRFADIWMGTELKRWLDGRTKAMVTGYSTVYHERQSNVLNNLEQEAAGIKMNETIWRGAVAGKNQIGDYQRLYLKGRNAWQAAIEEIKGIPF